MESNTSALVTTLLLVHLAAANSGRRRSLAGGIIQQFTVASICGTLSGNDCLEA